VKWLSREGGSNIGEAANDGHIALILAAGSGRLETVIWLLREGGSNIRDATDTGWTALILAAA
jgi:ankyrin repeat protein